MEAGNFVSIIYREPPDFHHLRTAYSLLVFKVMNRAELLERIWIDPKRCSGKPCIRGHRIWVSLILDLLANGMSFVEILEDYPDLTEADVQACIAYGAEMSRERYVNVALEPAA
jgi:uncharacterized protein (DUF433 family)